MDFSEELRRHLESIGQDHLQDSVAYRRVEADELRKHLVNRLRAEETSNPKNTLWIRRMHHEWIPRLPRLARYLERLAPQLAPVDPPGATAFARRVLDYALGRSPESIPLVDRLEVESAFDGFPKLRMDVETYALEVHLVRHGPNDELQITALGRTLLRLRGQDAVRWLLTIEVTQSLGDFDDWRTSRRLLEQASSNGGISQQHYPDEACFPFSEATLDRLRELGVLRGFVDDPGDDYVYEYQLAETMRDTARAAIDPGPWHSAVMALLEDERSLVVPGSVSGVAEASIAQTRLIAHEVRNALVPVRHHVDASLAADLDLPHRERLEAARRGVVRVLHFVDEMVATSELITEPATSFDVNSTIREVLSWLDGSDRIELDMASEPIRVRAQRSRLHRALSNIVQNALQSSPEASRIRITSQQADGDVRLVVEDAGPGVAKDARPHIFDDGYTTRAGGSGFGLAFVRQVIEGELRGKVWCEDSDLGGARFVVVIPKPEVRA